MKWIAFLLLGANLVLLGFHITGRLDERIQDGVPPEAEWAGTRRLRLVADLPPAERPPPRKALTQGALPPGLDTQPEVATSDPAVASPPPAGEASCYTATGFTDEQSALKTQAELEAAGVATGTLRTESAEHVRYWVLLPPFRSAAQASAAINRLKKLGIKDYYLIPKGENRNALSLGVFTTREAAQRRIAAVEQLKLKIQVEEVNFPGKQSFLDIRVAPVAAPRDWQRLLPAGIDVKKRPCKPNH